MKKSFKTLAIVLALCLVSGVLVGCGDGGIKTKVGDGGKYTYWVGLDSNVAHTHTGFGDLLMYQEMAKRTGVEIDFIHPASGSTGTEAFQILLSSGDYPDMIEYNWGEYTGEEAAEKANIESVGKANLQAAISNIILGKESMDAYDDAIKAVKKAGYDKLLKINQEAYNRYLDIINK